MHESDECGFQADVSVRQLESTPSTIRRRVVRSVSDRYSLGDRTFERSESTDIHSPDVGRISLSRYGSAVLDEDDVESAAILARTRMLMANPSFTDTSSSVRERKGQSLAVLSTPPPAQWVSSNLGDGLQPSLALGHDTDQDDILQYAPLGSRSASSPDSTFYA